MALFPKLKNFFIREAGKAIVARSQSEMTSRFAFGDADENKRIEKMKMFLRAYEGVPLITAIIDVQTDNAVTPFSFEGPNAKKLDKLADKVNLIRFFHRVVKSMLLYGNAYVEVVKNRGGEIVEFKNLDSRWFTVHRTLTGDIIGYSQTIEGKKTVLWGTTGNKSQDGAFPIKGPLKSISHFRYNVLNSDKYGTSVLNSMLEILQIKLDMESDLKGVVNKYVAPMIWAKVGSNEMPASSSQVSDIASTLRDLKSESEVTTSHLVDLSVLDFKDKGMDIKTPILHMESQVITGGQVPPVLLGRSIEKGEKGASEIQLRNFFNHMKSIQREVKFEFEDNIIVGQGIGTNKDKLVWEKSENRELEIDMDILRGLVTDGIITPQKANDLLPPRMQETLPEPILTTPLNGQEVGQDGQQKPRPSQGSSDKIKDNPNDPTKSTKNPRTQGKRRDKDSREEPNVQKKKRM